VENNVLSTLNILELCRIHKVKRVLLASSDKVYGEHSKKELESLPFKENYALRGLDIYSASKVCADTLAQAYAYQYKIHIAVLRCCNIYGPGDRNFTRLIPRTIMLLLSNKAPVIKVGHEQVLREYLYVDDAVRAYIFMAENLEKYYGPNYRNMPITGKQTYGWLAFNIGSYTGRQVANLSKCANIKNVKQIIEQLTKKIKYIKPVVISKPPKFIEIPDEYLDSSKIMALGYRTEIGLEQGFEKSIQWYRKHFKELEKQFLVQLKI
jgi:CDP-glucose 4,6-dehydratase